MLRIRSIVPAFVSRLAFLAALVASTTAPAVWSSAQTLEVELGRMTAAELATLARRDGDAARGAIVFYQPHIACSQCHSTGAARRSTLGPDLAALPKEVADAEIVESVLTPSKVIRKGYESVVVTTTDGLTQTALLVERTAEHLRVRDLARGGEIATIPAARIEQVTPGAVSIMPAGQVNQLAGRQQFLDLVRYLIELREGGAARARELDPPAALVAFTIPEYERHLDHATLIGEWNADSWKRGEAIYQRVCANCHGTLEKPGSLPTSPRFAEAKLKNGAAPLAMYQTLTRGFGLMAPQTWMVPSQKYDVIHYIREEYFKQRNPTQFVAVDANYLASLPPGDTRGPEPSRIDAWSAMDYGPSLAHTYEIPGLERNLAYKGVALRLDGGAGGVARGRHWMIFDTDTLRTAAGWSSSGSKDENFIDWRGIQFNGQHGVHPRVVGHVAFANSPGPGWADPATGRFADDRRVVGRDGRRYGPLPRDWGVFRGLYRHAQQTVLSYEIGGVRVLESPGLARLEGPSKAAVFLRTLNVGPRDRELVLQVAELPTTADAAGPIAAPIAGVERPVVTFHAPQAPTPPADPNKFAFDGGSFLEVASAGPFDMNSKDFTIVARIRTDAPTGSLFAIARPEKSWSPDSQTFFLRGGRIGFDIGWVGAVVGKKKVDDGRWHVVAVSWQQADKRLRLYVDGRLDAEGTLAAKKPLPDAVARIGFTTADFPRPQSFFEGEISELRFYQRRLVDRLDELAAAAGGAATDDGLIARWLPAPAAVAGAAKQAIEQVLDASGHGRHARVRRGVPSRKPSSAPLVAGLAPAVPGAEWIAIDGRLRLKIPAGPEPLRFTVWQATEEAPEAPGATAPSSGIDVFARRLAQLPIPDADRDLTAWTQGGPAQWPQKLTTQATHGPNDGPFAVDLLTASDSNPWLAQTRFTGLDFFADGRIAVCTWDGDVWIVEPSTPAASTPAAVTPAASGAGASLRWQRVATGMFQPLGLKIVGGKIHVTCRDQLTVLHDLNGDGETDFYECLNNDHQVTEHFHEFAMGLQTDAEGNFYYAKSGCHGVAAVVPHHGTLLRVSRDGSRTDILANGFRAANGVCLNPDGSFVVTDQEGFWNPKNRINWVTVDRAGKPKFYGNMLGYHDVTDSSDAAMEPPLCWITNAFDRSPAELLWVNSERWGPLHGSLLNLSYGYGKVFVVPHENVGGQMQGGMIELPLPSFPTGVMRGRFHPGDGQLYVCGMFAWAGNATQPGGLYRIRATGRPVHLATGLHATKSGLRLDFTSPLDPASADAKNFQVKSWALKRTAGYGSKHLDEKPLVVRGATLSADRRSLTLDVADLQPTWCMEIKYSLRSADDQPVVGVLHNTIHRLGE